MDSCSAQNLLIRRREAELMDYCFVVCKSSPEVELLVAMLKASETELPIFVPFLPYSLS